jgi:hypothetical protein
MSFQYLMKNAIFKFFVFLVIIIVRWGELDNSTGLSSITTSSLFILFVVAFISLVGEGIGYILSNFINRLTFNKLYSSFSILYYILIGWIVIVFVENLNLGFNYFDGYLLRDIVVYFLAGMSIEDKRWFR